MSMELKERLSRDRKKAIEEEEARQRELDRQRIEAENKVFISAAEDIVENAFSPVIEGIHDFARVEKELKFYAYFSQDFVKFDEVPEPPSPYSWSYGILKYHILDKYRLFQMVKEVAEKYGIIEDKSRSDNSGRCGCYFKMVLDD